MSIHYTIKLKKRGWNLTLRVTSSGEVVVSAPRFTPKLLVKRFVANNQAWIVKQQTRLKQQQQLMGSDFIYLFGKKYQLKVGNAHQAISGFYIVDDKVIYQPPASVKQQNQKIPQIRLEKWLKHTAENYIRPRAKQLADKMGLQFKRVSLKQQSTRWGSCSNQNNLNFNWRLVHFDPKVIDYVIIHELAHLKHMNHSRAFWALVAKYDGRYKEHKKVLREARWKRT